MTPEQEETALLIIEAVNLEDVSLDEIDPDEPIFNEGLGLDSIDALEISLVLRQRYGLKIKSGDTDIENVFSTVATLTDYIQANKQA